VKRALEVECDEESLKGLSKAVDTVRKQVSCSASDTFYSMDYL